MTGQGKEAFLLIDALRHSFEYAASATAIAMVVDAKDEQATSFHQHFRFLAFQKDPRQLYLPMKTVAQLLKELIRWREAERVSEADP